jgi:hypothetical protein
MGNDKGNSSKGNSGGNTLKISDDYLQSFVQNKLDGFIEAITDDKSGFPEIKAFASLAANGGTPGGDADSGYTGVLPGNGAISMAGSGLPQQAQLLKSNFTAYAGTLFTTIDGLTTNARTLKQNVMNVKSVLDDASDSSNLTANEMLADMQNVSVIPSSGGAAGLAGAGLAGSAGGLAAGNGGLTGGASGGSVGGVGGAPTTPAANTTGSGGTSGSDTTSGGGVEGTQMLLSTGGGGSAGVAPSIGVTGSPMGEVGWTGVAPSMTKPAEPLGALVPAGSPGATASEVVPALPATVFKRPTAPGAPVSSELQPAVQGARSSSPQAAVPAERLSFELQPAVQGAPSVAKVAPVGATDSNASPGTAGAR